MDKIKFLHPLLLVWMFLSLAASNPLNGTSTEEGNEELQSLPSNISGENSNPVLEVSSSTTEKPDPSPDPLPITKKPILRSFHGNVTRKRVIKIRTKNDTKPYSVSRTRTSSVRVSVGGVPQIDLDVSHPSVNQTESDPSTQKSSAIVNFPKISGTESGEIQSPSISSASVEISKLPPFKNVVQSQPQPQLQPQVQMQPPLVDILRIVPTFTPLNHPAVPLPPQVQGHPGHSGHAPHVSHSQSLVQTSQGQTSQIIDHRPQGLGSTTYYLPGAWRPINSNTNSQAVNLNLGSGQIVPFGIRPIPIQGVNPFPFSQGIFNPVYNNDVFVQSEGAPNLNEGVVIVKGKSRPRYYGMGLMGKVTSYLKSFLPRQNGQRYREPYYTSYRPSGRF